MRVINWKQILDENHIQYVERGANVKRGELNIKCPYCGSADPSHHLGLSQDTGWWACWRNSDHRGKSPVRLLVALLRISYRKARELAGLDEDYVDPDGFDDLAARLLRSGQSMPELEDQAQGKLRMGLDYQKFTSSGGRNRRFFNYLESRLFRDQDILKLAWYYNLRHCISGPFQDRLIIPYYLNGELITWAGRAVGESTIRYKALSIEDSILATKRTLYNYDAHKQADVLVLVEGPIDALKLDFYGKRFGVRSVALSTNSINDEQIYLLEEAASKVRKVIIMLDTQTSLGVVASMRMRERLGQIPNSQIQAVPYGMKDAGELSYEQALSYTEELSND